MGKSHLVIFAVLALTLLICPPYGEFPLNDDWDRAHSVEHFLSTGRLKNFNFTPMSMVFQTIWGVLFSKLFGYSFTTLRLSVLVLSIIAVFVFYQLLRELSLSNQASLLGAFMLFFNPLYFSLSYTFMTEIPFVSMMIISVFFFIKSAKKNNDTYLLISILFSVFSFLIRQNGILIPFSYLAYLFLSNKLTKKKFLMATLLPGAAFLAFHYWFYFINGLPLRYMMHSGDLVSILIPLRIIYASFAILMIISLYFFPFIALISYSSIRKCNKLLLLSVFIILLIGGLIHNHLFNYWPHLLNTQGYGIFPNSDIIYFSPLLLFIFFIIAAIGGSFLIISAKSYKYHKPLDYVVYIVAGLQIFFVLVTSGFFDRYVIPAIPAFILFVLRQLKPNALKLGYFFVILFAAFSIITTIDYFRWNTARWDALNFLTSNNISPHEIDGGFEFNGYYLSEYMFNVSENKIDPSLKNGKIFLHDDKYIVATYIPENYELIKTYPIHYLFMERSFYVSRRIGTLYLS